MPTPARVPDELRTQVFRGSRAVRAGLLTRRQLHGSAWRRLFQDVYVHRDLAVTHRLRAVAATVLLPEAVVSGTSAASFWGVDLARDTDDVEVTLPPSSHMVRVVGIRARRAQLSSSDVERRSGVRVTTPTATAIRLAGALPTVDAVIAVDRPAATGYLDVDLLRVRAAKVRGPGSARARQVADLADGLAESPQETRVRLIIGASDLPAPVAQYRVVVEDRFVARVDFAWPAHRVAVEYDGLWHGEAAQFVRDRQRLNRLREAGWRVVFVTAADLRDPDRLVAVIARALAS